MVIAFENLFLHPYEAGISWLEATLAGLGMLPEPPTCIILGAVPQDLPPSARHAAHVVPVALADAAPSARGRIASAIQQRLRPGVHESPAVTAVAQEYDIDVWIGFGGFSGLGRDRPLVLCFPDFQFRHLPEMFGPGEVAAREQQWLEVSARANGLMALSQTVVDDALASSPEVAPKIRVCGFRPFFTMATLAQDPDETRRRYDLPENFLLVSNQVFRHKNHGLVLDALSALKRTGRAVPTVAFTGRPYDPRNPDHFSALLQQTARDGLHDDCRFLGVVSRAEQVALIRAARAVVQPSLFEGRGAIVEESAVLGTPLICSDLPVHREQWAPRARFFDPRDAAALTVLLEDLEVRERKTVEAIVADSTALTRDYGERVLALSRLAQSRAQP
jgi:glycosyltransferase involved in cell wall biosynthesis